MMTVQRRLSTKEATMDSDERRIFVSMTSVEYPGTMLSSGNLSRALRDDRDLRDGGTGTCACSRETDRRRPRR